jgi:hypothetical protein
VLGQARDGRRQGGSRGEPEREGQKLHGQVRGTEGRTGGRRPSQRATAG